MTLQIQIIIAGVLLAFGLASGFAGGYKYHQGLAAIEAAKIKEAEKQKRDDLAASMSVIADALEKARESNQKFMIERMKNVHKVTGNKPCLSADAVRVLNDPVSSERHAYTSQLKTESSSDLAASDTDVAYWITQARELYTDCAVRQNSAADILIKLEDNNVQVQ